MSNKTQTKNEYHILQAINLMACGFAKYIRYNNGESLLYLHPDGKFTLYYRNAADVTGVLFYHIKRSYSPYPWTLEKHL